MSGETNTTSVEPQTSLANGADTSAPADKPDDFLPEAKTEAEPSKEGKAEGGKSTEVAQEAEDDFLKAEANKDSAKDKADGQADVKPGSESAEAYQPFTLPEGFEGELDQTLVDKATPILRDLKLDQDGAQKLVSFFATEIVQQQQESMRATMQGLADGHQATLRTWEKELTSLPEYQGDGLKEAKVRVANVLSTLGSPELRTLLHSGRDGYGLIRNPAVFKFLDAIGSKLSQDSLVRDDAGAPVKGGQLRDADIMYGAN